MVRRRKARRRKSHNFTYGKDFAGHQKNKKSLVWGDAKEKRKNKNSWLDLS